MIESGQPDRARQAASASVPVSPATEPSAVYGSAPGPDMAAWALGDRAPRPGAAGRSRTMGRARRLLVDCLGLAPFLLLCLMAELLPIWSIVRLALTGIHGELTMAHYGALFSSIYVSAFTTSIALSLATALIGALLGPPMIYAALQLGRASAGFMSALSAVGSNFAGVPLAFTFIATLGVEGLLTTTLHDHLGIDIYHAGFNLFSVYGLAMCYVYFQLPLMILLIAPALAGLRHEWREAAATLGAPAWRFWWHIGIPVLRPTVLAATALLFANAFGTYGTAYALSDTLNIVSVQLSVVIDGDASVDIPAGAALATLMILVMLVCILFYQILRSRGQRWAV